MDHLAIMKKSWGLTKKILRGEKTIDVKLAEACNTQVSELAKKNCANFGRAYGGLLV